MRRTTILFILAAHALLHAQQYTRRDEMIPMRDGVRLHTQIFTLNDAATPLPFLLLRTPYGIGSLDSARLTASMPELCADGYIFVLQDIRGRFKSEGQFVMLRQPRDPK